MSWMPGEIPSSAKLKTLFSLFAELERQQQQQHSGCRGKMARDELEEGERLMEVTISLKVNLRKQLAITFLCNP